MLKQEVPKMHEICTCSTCGYEWMKGKSGDHPCSTYLLKRLEILRTKFVNLHRTASSLVFR